MRVMKSTKLVFVATALLALVSLFALDYLSSHGMGFTLWSMRKLEVPHGYIILGAVALPLGFGGLALATQRLPRWQALLSVVAYLIALAVALLVFKKTQTTFAREGAIGAKLMLLALAAGLVAALAGTVKPQTAA